jgi:copper resistance protein C
MKTFRALGLTAALGVALGIALVPATARDSAASEEALRHLRLLRSVPAADAVLTESPTEIRLFFSEEPQLRGSSVRLTIGEETLVETTEVAASKEDATQFVIRPSKPLAAGSYTVHWRIIASDGHTQRGTYRFRIGS